VALTSRRPLRFPTNLPSTWCIDRWKPKAIPPCGRPARQRARAALQSRLTEAGIGTLIHYPVAPHLQPAYKSLGFERGAFPISERIHDEVLSLPFGPELTDAQVREVVETVVGVCRELS